MHLAYSALKTAGQQKETNKTPGTNTLLIRYRAYQETCTKYTREIAAIQKYLPGWAPAFNY